MIIVNPNLRVTQYYNKKQFGITIPKETHEIIDVNKTIFKLLKAINDEGINTYQKLSKIVSKSIIKHLYDKRIILDNNEFIHNENVLNESKIEFPLHTITIELTNACNLNCIHCYGKFGHPSHKKMIKLEDIIKMKSELDKLHTMEVRLTGGESFSNPDFEKIALFFLENGFKVSIYTNGFETERILKFAESTKEYNYFMGISLDGTEPYHDLIRGDKNSFENVINTLKKLKDYPNIDILIATSIMKHNFDDIQSVKQLKEDLFPNYDQQIFLATPVTGSDFSFDYKSLPQLKDKCPDLFDDYLPVKTGYFSERKKHRCQGGVSHCALTVDGIMKICPIADEDAFIIGDTKDSSIYDVWVNPNEPTRLFRKEYVKRTPQCKKCKSKKQCGFKNCRIEALRLTGDYLNANPYTCMIIKGSY